MPSIILRVITIWLNISRTTTRRALKIHAASQESIKTNDQTLSKRKSTTDTGSPPETLHQRRTTQISPYAIGTQVSSGGNKTVNGRTGCVSCPGYQTLFVNISGRRNFSIRAQTASVNYSTIQQNDLIDVIGTPTKNFGQSVSIDDGAATDEEYMQVFDGTTRSFGWVKRSKVAAQEN